MTTSHSNFLSNVFERIPISMLDRIDNLKRLKGIK